MRLYKLHRCYFILGALVTLFSYSQEVMAERLKRDACKGLTKQKNALIKAGAAKNMKKGPDWAKNNLNEAALAEIKSFIDISEKLIFQCNQKGLQVAGKPEEALVKKKETKFIKSTAPLPARRPASSVFKKIKRDEIKNKKVTAKRLKSSQLPSSTDDRDFLESLN